MIVADVSVIPIGKGESVGSYVARAVDIIDRSGLKYRLGPMGTCIEGEWDEVFGVIRKCWEELSRECDRISISIKVDYRKGARGGIGNKVASVEQRLGRKLTT